MVAAARKINAVILTTLALLWTAPSWADFKRDYTNGLKAMREQNWQAAATALQSAIEDNPAAAERVRMYGMRFEPYLPYYYLGEARFRLGDCSGALNAWDEALSQGPVKASELASQLEQRRATCAASSIDVSALVQQAQQNYDLLNSDIARLRSLRDNRLLSTDWQANPAWQTALDRAQTQAEELAETIAAASTQQDQAALEQAASTAESARGLLEEVLQPVATRLASLELKRRRDSEQARVEMIQAIAAARPATKENTSDERARALQQELATLIQREVALGNDASAAEYRATARAVSVKLREYQQALQELANQRRAIAARTPPSHLKQAAEAYFKGHYDQTVELANPGDFQNDRERIQAHLFRAAARFHLYVLSGAEREVLLRQAENDIRSIKRLDDAFSPFLAAFPPKFISLFQQTL